MESPGEEALLEWLINQETWTADGDIITKGHIVRIVESLEGKSVSVLVYEGHAPLFPKGVSREWSADFRGVKGSRLFKLYQELARRSEAAKRAGQIQKAIGLLHPHFDETNNQ